MTDEREGGKPSRFFQLRRETMKPTEAIAKADKLKPNMLDAETKLGFINDIEGMLFDEIIMTHEHPEDIQMPVYTLPEVGDDEPDMLAPTRYAMLYVHWIKACIDDLNQELDKYNNDRALFEDSWNNFKDYWTRTHMPITAMPTFIV